MHQVTLDTSCVVNLLSAREPSPPELLRLVWLALDGRLRLTVTDIVDEEVPKGDDDAIVDRRAYIRQKIRQFPVSEISASRSPERDARAREILGQLWPNVTEGSRKHSNSLRDCLHLAGHILCAGDLFVTLDQELARKANTHREVLGITVLSPAQALSRVEREAPSSPHLGSWNPVVRKAREDDRGEIKALLTRIRDSYNDFDAWLRGALTEKELWIAQLDDAIGAVAVWSRKTETTVKLATFFVGDDYRGRALGPHLLFHQLRLWIDNNISKVFVTVSSERLEALSFFLEYGFRIEGSSARRYKSTAVEFVLAKHLFYAAVSDDSFDGFLADLGRQVFDLPEHDDVRSATSWFLPPSFGALRAVRDSGGCVAHIELLHGDAPPRELSTPELEKLVYPARFALAGRKAYMIPIMPQWADRMMHVPRPQIPIFSSNDRLALRTDNIYYSHPFYANEDLVGAPALFYISAPDQFVAGFARITERIIADPEDLYLRYERLGIYGLDDIRTHVKKTGPLQGSAMAVRFAWWVPFPKPVSLAQLRAMGLHHPQHIEAIDYAMYEKLLTAGGITW